MAKIKINLKLNQNNKQTINETINAIEIHNNIKYKLENTINVFNKNKKTLKRTTDEYDLILDYNEELAKYIYKNHELELKLKTKKLIITETKIEIEYKIIETNDIFKYELEVIK